MAVILDAPIPMPTSLHLFLEANVLGFTLKRLVAQLVTQSFRLGLSICHDLKRTHPSITEDVLYQGIHRHHHRLFQNVVGRDHALAIVIGSARCESSPRFWLRSYRTPSLCGKLRS